MKELTTGDLAAALHVAIWDLSQTDDWPILGDDFPAAEKLAEMVHARLAASEECAPSPDGWCMTHSTGAGPVYCGTSR